MMAAMPGNSSSQGSPDPDRWRDAALADETRRAYSATAGRLARWRRSTGRSGPLDADDIAAWLADMADEGLAPNTVGRHLAAARRLHRDGAVDAETGWHDTAAVRETMAGIRRGAHDRGRGQADGITDAQVADMIELAAGAGLAGTRDAALIAVMSAALLRRSEAAALDVDDVDLDRRTVTIRRSKTDQEHRGAVKVITGAAAERLAAWIDAARITRGPLWRPVKGDVVLDRRLAAEAVGRIVPRRAKAAGVTGRITSHSLRRGGAQALIDAGAPNTEVMAAGNWATESTATAYARGAPDAAKAAAARRESAGAGAGAAQETKNGAAQDMTAAAVVELVVGGRAELAAAEREIWRRSCDTAAAIEMLTDGLEPDDADRVLGRVFELGDRIAAGEPEPDPEPPPNRPRPRITPTPQADDLRAWLDGRTA